MAQKRNNFKFSFIESLTREQRDPFQDWHFERVFNDVRRLEQWMKNRHIEDTWTLTEKLAFLRNVESTIRTGSAVRRTQLAWFAMAIATIAALIGIVLGISL